MEHILTTKREQEMLIEICLYLQIYFNYDAKKSATWLRTKNLNLGGSSAFDLMNKGRIKTVYKFVRAASQGEL